MAAVGGGRWAVDGLDPRLGVIHGVIHSRTTIDFLTTNKSGERCRLIFTSSGGHTQCEEQLTGTTRHTGDGHTVTYVHWHAEDTGG